MCRCEHETLLERARRVATRSERGLHIVAEAHGALLVGQAPAVRDFLHHAEPKGRILGLESDVPCGKLRVCYEK